MTRSNLFGTLILLISTLACSGEEGSSVTRPPSATTSASDPKSVAVDFLAAVQASDRDALNAYLTPAAAAALGDQDGFGLSGEGIESFDVGEVNTTREHAEVSATIVEGGESQEMVLLLKQVQGNWGVSGVNVAFGDGTFTMDFEAVDDMFDGLGEQLGAQIGEAFAEGMQTAFDEAQNTWEQGGTPEEIAEQRRIFENTEAISEEQHDAAWRVDVQGAGRSASDVFTELLAGSGIRLESEGFERELSQPVDLELKGVSRIEALERVAASIGVHFVWPDLDQVGWFGEDEPAGPVATVAAGARTRSATFAGPFLVEVSEVIEYAPQPTGELTLAVRAIGLDKGVVGFQEEMFELLRVSEVREASNQALTDEDVRYLGTPNIDGDYLTYDIDLDLNGLLRRVERIEPIRGEVRLKLPASIESASVRSTTESTVETSVGTLEVETWGESTSLRLAGDGVADLQVRSSASRSDGSALGRRSSGAYGWGDRLDISLDCPEEPASIDLKICRVQELVYEFELPPIALPEFAKRPEQLTKLTLDGDAPFSVSMQGELEFDQGMAEIRLQIASRCNKDIEMAVVSFEYLDAGGVKLEDFPHTLTGDYDFDAGANGPLLAKGQRTERTTHAAFAPESTRSVRFDVQRAEFSDGTVWEK